MSSPILQCPLCSKPFGILPEQAGQAVQCPNCNQAVRVPPEIGASVPPAPSQPPPNQPLETEVFGCPVCSGQFAITPDMQGQQVGCPHCQSTILIHPASSPSPDPPSPKIEVRKRDPSEEEVDESDLFAPGYQPKTEENSAAQPVSQANADSLDQQAEIPPVTPGLSQVVGTPQEEASSQTEPAAETDAEYEPENIDHLLPPRFDVLDPQQLALRRRHDSDQKVILPDGKGGLSKVDDRFVTITHKGEEINLISLPPEQLRRKRQIQNSIAIIIGAIVLAIVFALLRKST